MFFSDLSASGSRSYWLPSVTEIQRHDRPSIANIERAVHGAISFQDTSYGRRSFGRPKSRDIAFLSPHPPVIECHGWHGLPDPHTESRRAKGEVVADAGWW